jgi:hypothetical protein
MTLTTYIKSCGTYAENGYRWSDRNNAFIATPQPIEEIREFIQSDAFSVILQQKPEKSLLLVTGIESGRKDYRGRKIRNSIAWIGDSKIPEKDRKKLQKLAASALRNELDNRINSSIIEEGGDFKVLWEQIDQIEEDYAKALSFEQYPDSAYKIAKNTDGLRQDLAEELETANLEKKKNFLVIVTGNKSEETLKKAGVWRGLSNLVPYEKWQEYKPKNVARVPLLAIIGAIAILVILVFSILFFLNSETQDLDAPPSEETPQETVEPESTSPSEKTPQEAVEAESSSETQKQLQSKETPQETVENQSRTIDNENNSQELPVAQPNF